MLGLTTRQKWEGAARDIGDLWQRVRLQAFVTPRLGLLEQAIMIVEFV